MAKQNSSGLPRVVLFPLAALGAVVVACLAPAIAEAADHVVSHTRARLKEMGKGKG